MGRNKIKRDYEALYQRYLNGERRTALAEEIGIDVSGLMSHFKRRGLKSRLQIKKGAGTFKKKVNKHSRVFKPKQTECPLHGNGHLEAISDHPRSDWWCTVMMPDGMKCGYSVKKPRIIVSRAVSRYLTPKSGESAHNNSEPPRAFN